jgi:uncharacterized protein (DUF2141 family)
MRKQTRVFSVLADCLVVVCAVPRAGGASSTKQPCRHCGLRNNKGQVFCALFTSAEGFPKDSQKAIRRETSPVSEKKASCEFLGIEPGTYGVSVFHDENSNGKFDMNFLGIPREGVRASNNARGQIGPPNSMVLSSNLPEAGCACRSHSTIRRGAL